MVAGAALSECSGFHHAADKKKPNILILWGDDIGLWNISAYNMGMMGYKTPAIDSIAKMARSSPTGIASRAAPPVARLSSPVRSASAPAISKVGLPARRKGCRRGMSPSPSCSRPGAMRPRSSAKNHLGDADETLPTGPRLRRVLRPSIISMPVRSPKTRLLQRPTLIKKYARAAIFIRSFANRTALKIEDTGPLTEKRMETVDEEFTAKAVDYLEKRREDGKPFFLWWNATRMHIRTHLKKESQGVTGLGVYPDGMVEHDGQSARSSPSSKNWASMIIPSSCIPPTTARKRPSGPMAASSPFRAEEGHAI